MAAKRPNENTKTSSGRVRLDDRGVAWIAGTNTKVIEVVLDQVACGWTPDEIQAHHSHLSPEQIRAALDYYHEHQAEIDAGIEQRYRQVEQRRSLATDQFTRKELEARLQERERAKKPA